MKLEIQVCSLEFAKRLKELGVKQESAFRFSPEGLLMRDEQIIEGIGYAAFTVAELGEMLPMEPKPDVYFETMRLAEGAWTVTYQKGKNNPLAFVMGDTEADARATVLIYLIEKNLITLP